MPNILGYVPGQLDLSMFADEWRTPPYRGIISIDGREVRSQVVVSEDLDDDLIITEHPIEGGSFIHDHAFKRPSEVRVQMGWTNAYAWDTGKSHVNQIYQEILALQASRLPFTVYTGRRVYHNMLIASLRTHTDQRLEFSFLADMVFREVVLVNTHVVLPGDIFNASTLADPESNTPVLATGPLQTLPAVIPAEHVPMGSPEGLPF